MKKQKKVFSISHRDGSGVTKLSLYDHDGDVYKNIRIGDIVDLHVIQPEMELTITPSRLQTAITTAIDKYEHHQKNCETNQTLQCWIYQELFDINR